MAERPTIVTEAVDFLRVAKKAEDPQRDRERDDLRFQVPELTWSEEARAARMSTTIQGVPVPARPMLSLATLDEPLQLVENGYRDAHLGVNIHPMSADASDDTAEVLQGIYRSIEVNSRAAAIPRAWGYSRSLRCGRGAYRIISEYDTDSPVPGDQRLVIKRILFQDSVYLDPFAEEPDWSDGERAAIVSDLPWTTYKRKYKKTDLSAYSDSDLMALGHDLPDWIGGEGPDSRTVRIAEYFYVEHESTSHTIPGAGKDGADLTVEYDERHVKWVKVNGIEVLEEGEWPGPYIPIVPTIGKELQPFDGKRRWIGMISNAKDGVRLVNYAASGAVEMAALEPKAPWMMEEGQDSGFEWEYQQANIRNFPTLHFRSNNLLGQRVSGPPQRVQVNSERLGPNMMLLSMGKDFVQSATQTYEPSLGKQTPAHRSGEAIKALQGQGIEGTSNYTGNLAEISMTLEAKILLWAIPHYYDRAGRVVQILDGEDKARNVMLNQPYQVHPQTKQPMPMPPNGAPSTPAAQPPQVGPLGLQAPQQPPKIYHYDLKKGRYGVTVTVGKSAKSKLEQGQSEIGDIMQSDPALVPLIGPIYFKYRDGPGMREIAKVLQKQRDHMMPWLSDDPSQQPNVSQLMAENQHLKQVSQQQGQALATKQVEQQGKIQIAQQQGQIDLQTTQMNNETKIAVAELSAKVERLALFLEERARIGAHIADVGQTVHDAAHQRGMAAVEHANALEQADQAHQQATAQNQQTADNALVQQAAAPAPENPA